MAKLGIFTGTSPNDTTGDTLSQGAVKINSNFSEIYSAIGDGTNITNSLSSITVAGLSTFTNGPVVIGSGIQTGTSKLQVSGNTFITGSVGVGTTNPGEKLQVDGNIRVGISTTSNYIAFRGTYNDDQTTYLNTFIGERIYDYSGVNAERSELLLFKGNDVADSGVGPDRIRLAAGEFRFDTYSTIGGVLPGYASPLSFESAATLENITNKMILTGTGNLGIGTTIPIRILHLSKNSAAEFIIEQSNSRADFKKWNFVADGGSAEAGTTGNFYLRLLNDAGNATSKLYWYINGSNNTQSFYDTVLINSASPTGTASQPLQVGSATTALGAYISGNLGIGTTTPTESLHVVGNVKVTGTITGSFSSTVATATTATNVSGGIGSVTQLQVTGLSTFTNGPVLVGRATTTGTANQALQVGSATTALGAYISGNLGIGTTNPGEKLQVDGNIRVGISTTSNYIAFRGTLDDDQTTYTHTYIGERIYESGTERSELLLFKGNDPLGNPGPDRIRLAAGEFKFDTYYGVAASGTFEQVATSANITNKMILTGTGNLGIGTTNPTSSLSVNGSTVIGTEILDMTGLSSTFTTVGSNTFTVPAGVTKISAVLIGGGGAGGGGSAGQDGGGSGGQGGGGGGLRYINDFPVTPGQSFTVIVGAGGNGGTGVGENGGDSEIVGVATAFGGTGGAADYTGTVGTGGTGSIIAGNIGGSSGGNGGEATLTTGAGGGGSAGYSGNGGSGGNGSGGSGGAGSGGGAGGGGGGGNSGSGGGGVGVLGLGSSGSLSNGAGNAGSGGSNGSTGNTNNGAAGGLYGGGGGGADGFAGSVTSGGNGAQGAVRIIFSPQSKFSRLFPTNQVGNNINQ